MGLRSCFIVKFRNKSFGRIMLPLIRKKILILLLLLLLLETNIHLCVETNILLLEMNIHMLETNIHLSETNTDMYVETNKNVTYFTDLT